MYRLLLFCSIIAKIYGRDQRIKSPRIDVFIVNPDGFQRHFLSDLSKSDVTFKELPIPHRNTKITSSYQIRCTASFPIVMDYDGEGTPRVRVSSYRRLLNRTENFLIKVTNQFEIRVTLAPQEYNSGKYICQSVSNAQTENYLYLFIPGPKIFIADKPEYLGTLTHHDQRNHINFINETRDQLFLGSDTPGGSSVRIPCATSSDSIAVRLFEQTIQDGKVVSLDITETATFSPKKGFLLKIGKLLKRPRDFTCHGVDLEKGLNDIIAYSLNPLLQNGTTSLNHLSTVEISEECERRNSFTCSVSPVNTPVFFGRKDCFSQTECKFMEKRLRKSFLPRMMRSESGNFNLTYNTVCSPIPMIKGEYESDTTLAIGILHVSGIFFCSCGRNRLSTLVYNSFKHKIVQAAGTDMLEKLNDTHDILLILQSESFTRSKRKINRTITKLGFVCIGRSFFYTHGFVWKLEMEDGTVKYHLGEENDNHPSAYIKNTLALDNANEVQSLTCYAPRWDSDDWDSHQLIPSSTLANADHHPDTNKALTLSMYQFFIIIPFLLI